MAVEDVGGIGISLEIKDDTEAALNAIQAKLEAIVNKKWSAVVDVKASGKGASDSSAQEGVEAKVASAFKTGIDNFTAALKDFKVKIDPASIASIAKALRESGGDNVNATSSYSGTAGKETALTRGRAEAVRTGVAIGQATYRDPQVRRGLALGVADGTAMASRRGMGFSAIAQDRTGGQSADRGRAYAVAQRRGGVEWRYADEGPVPKPKPKKPTYSAQAADMRAGTEEIRGRGGKPAWAEGLTQQEALAKVRSWQTNLTQEFAKIKGKEKNRFVAPLFEALNEAKGVLSQMEGRINKDWETVPATRPVKRVTRPRRPRATTPAATQEERAAESAEIRTETTAARPLSGRARIDARTWLPVEERGLDAGQRRALIRRDRVERAEQELGVVAGGALHARVIRREPPVIEPRQLHTTPGQERVPYRGPGEYDAMTGEMATTIGGTRFVDPHALAGLRRIPSGGSSTPRIRMAAAFRRRVAAERAAGGLEPTPAHRRTLPVGRLGEIEEERWRTGSYWDPAGERGAAPSALTEHEGVLESLLARVKSGQIRSGLQFTEPRAAMRAAKKAGQPITEEQARLAVVPDTDNGLYEFIRDTGLRGKTFNLPEQFEGFAGLQVRPVPRHEVVRQLLQSEMGANWDALQADPRAKSQLAAFLQEIRTTKVRLGLPQSGKMLGPNVPAIGREERPMILGKSRERRREQLFARRNRGRIERGLGLAAPQNAEARRLGIRLTEADQASIARGRQDIAKGKMPGFEDRDLAEIPELMQQFSLQEPGNELSLIDFRKRLGTYTPVRGSTEKLTTGIKQRLQISKKRGGRGFGSGLGLKLPSALESLIRDADSWARNISQMRAAEATPKLVAEELKTFGPATSKRTGYQMAPWEASVERIDDPKLTLLLRRRAILEADESNRESIAKFESGKQPDKDRPDFTTPKMVEWGWKSRATGRIVPESSHKPSDVRVGTLKGFAPVEADKATEGLSAQEVEDQIQERLLSISVGPSPEEFRGSRDYQQRKLAERDIARRHIGAPVDESEFQEHLAGTRKTEILAKPSGEHKRATEVPAAAVPTANPIQAAYDARNIAEGQRLNVAAGVAAGGTAESGGAMLPPGGSRRRAASAGTADAALSGGGIIRVHVVDITKGTVTITNPTALRPEKAAATAATGTAAATTAAKTPAVPEGATKFGPQGGVRPGEYGAKRVGPGESPPNIDTATMTAAAMAEVRADKQAAVAKVAADKAKAAEAKRIATVPFKQRVEEKTQAYLKTMPMAGAPYYAPAGAAEPVRPFEGVELDAAKQMALREELKILGKTPSDLKADTWGARAADLKRRKPGLTNAQVKARIQKKVRKLENLVGPGVVGDPGDDLDEFMDNVMAAGGLGPAPRPGRVPAQQNQAKILRKYGLAVEQPVSRVGATEEAGSGAAARLSGAQARVAQRKQDVLGFPMRAMSTGVLVGVSRAIGPFEAIKSRQAKMEKAFGEYQKLENQQSGEQLEFRAAMKTRRELRTTLAAGVAANTITPAQAAEDFEVFSKPLRETAGHLRDLGTQTNNAYKSYDKLDKAVIKSTDSLQHYSASFVGAIAGGFIGAMAGMIAQPLVQAATQGIAKIGAPIADALSGWGITAANVQEKAAQATTAKGGLAAAAFAQQYITAPTGVTAPFEKKATEIAEIQSGTERLKEIRDAYRGYSGEGGAARFLTKGQGGIGNTGLFSDRQYAGEIMGSFVSGRGFNQGIPEWAAQQRPNISAVNELLFAEGTGRYAVRPVEGTDKTIDVETQARLMNKSGLGSFAGSLVFIDRFTGKIVSAADAAGGLTRALDDSVKGLLKTNPEKFIEQQRGQIRAQIQGMEAQRQFTIEEAAPMQRGMNWLAAPPQPYGTGWMPGMQSTAGLAMGYLGAGNFEAAGAAMGAGIGMPPVPTASGYDVATGALTPNAAIPPEAIESFNKYASIGQDAFAKVSQAAERGIAKLREAKVPEESIQSMMQLGAQATALQTQLAGIQTERATTKYNHDLAIANRSLNDAKQLTGQIGKNSSDNVGYYERQLLLINRASTALSLQLQQRQITTQQAIAGFAVQGDTPEIRMARRKEAMLEAEIANKQLGYSKQAFGTEIKLVDAQNLRQVADAAYAVSDMTRDWKAMWDSKAIEDALSKVQAALEIPTTEANAWVSYFSGYKQYMIQLAVELAAITETEVSKMITAIDEAIKGNAFFSLLFGNAETPRPTEGGASGPGSSSSGVGSAPKSTPVDPAWYKPRALGPQDRAIWGARLGITPKSAAGGRGADMGNPSAGYAFPNAVPVTTNNTTNNNQKVEISPVYNITLPSLDQEQVADLTTKVVKSINTALALVGLRPVAR